MRSSSQRRAFVPSSSSYLLVLSVAAGVGPLGCQAPNAGPTDGGPSSDSDAAPDAGTDPDAGTGGDAGMQSPMPIISWGVPAYAATTYGGYGASNANDGTQQNFWRSSGYPTWLAYDLSSTSSLARQRTVLSWWAPACYGYDTSQFGPAYNLPGDYVVEGNPGAGGGSPPSSGWVQLLDPGGNAISVTGNVITLRTHVVMLNGMNWIRLRVTAGASTNDSMNTDSGIAMDVHDAGQGIDAWNFVGDSIVALYQTHGTPTGVAPGGYADGNWQGLVHDGVSGLFAGNSAFRPAFEGNGLPGSTTADWVTRIASYLPSWPGQYVGIQLGANDGASQTTPFYGNMISICDSILAAGKVPVLATMTWQDPATHQDMTGLAAQIPLLLAHYNGRALAGPDLFAFFSQSANQHYITDNDGLHPSAAGQAIVRNLWAQTAHALIY